MCPLCCCFCSNSGQLKGCLRENAVRHKRKNHNLAGKSRVEQILPRNNRSFYKLIMYNDIEAPFTMRISLATFSLLVSSREKA